MDSALDHLRAALAAMKASRDALVQELEEADRQILIVQRTVSELSGGNPLTADAFDDSPSIRDTAREVAQSGAVFTLAHVVAAVRATGNDAKYGSISSILSRMVKEGELRKVSKRGAFVRANATVAVDASPSDPGHDEDGHSPQSDEDPAEAGSSHGAQSQEGGGSDGTSVIPER